MVVKRVDSPSVENNATPVRDFFELKGKLDQVVADTARIRESEEKFTKHFGGFVLLLFAVVGTVNFLSFKQSSEQATKAIDQAEQRVANLVEKSETYIKEITGNVRPTHATVTSGLSTNPDLVRMGFSVSFPKGTDIGSFELVGRATVQVDTFGPPGKFIGNQTYLDGAIVDYFSSHPNAISEEVRRNSLVSAAYSIQDENGFQVVEGVPFRVLYTVTTNFATCEEAEQRLERIVQHSGELGQLYFRPVFESIGNVGSYTPFKIESYDNRLFDCEEFRQKN